MAIVETETRGTEPIVKKCFTISTVRDIVPMMREAFQVASSGVPGPVFIELPLDVLYCPLDIMVEMGWFEEQQWFRCQM